MNKVGVFGQTVGRTIPRPRVCVVHLLSAATEGGVKIAAQGCSPWVSPSLCSPRLLRLRWNRAPEAQRRFSLAETRYIGRASVTTYLARPHWLPESLSAWSVAHEVIQNSLTGELLSLRLPKTPTIPFHGGCVGATPPRRQLTVAKERWMGLGGEFLPCATLGQRMPSGVLGGAQPATLK